MSHHNDPGQNRLTGQGLPGTGGDASPTDLDHDVEGHRFKSGDREDPDAPQPEGARAVPDGTEDGKDVEGHLFRMGPTTEGEFSRRGPGENPHGDR